MENSQQLARHALVWVFVIFLLVIGGAYAVLVYSAREQAGSGTGGEKETVSPYTSSMFKLMSSAFQTGAPIPSKYTCDGANTSPALSWSGVPSGTKSFALIMDDPDVPKQLMPTGVFDHWVLFNIPSTTTEISANGSIGIAGINGAGTLDYTGPCPPSQYEPSEHRYFFRLYALDVMLNLPQGATKAHVLEALQGHVLQTAELMGVYKKQQ